MANFQKQFIFKDIFSLPQLLLLGALGQIAIFAILPSRYALLPAVFLLLHSVATAAIQSTSPERNTFLNGTIPARTSAQIPNATYNPDPDSGKSLFGSRAASQEVVVLHLGVRYSHPLGPLAPGAQQTTAYFIQLVEDLSKRAEEYGCTGFSTWRAAERSSNNTLMSVFYFRSVEGLHAFAHDKAHREAWDWLNKYIKDTGHTHLGVFHETFMSAPGAYETIYVNMHPMLLGGTNVKVHNEQSGEDEYVVPLVNADVTTLRSQYGRMDRKPDGTAIQR